MRILPCCYTILILVILSCYCFNGCQGCMEEERRALLQIRDSINSAYGSAFSSWLGEDCCRWEGVLCNATTSRVDKIFFQDKRDSQESEMWFPNVTMFAQFKDLRSLHLGRINIGGFVAPEAFRQMKQLRKLYLQGNSIKDGAHLCWGNMPSLNVLDLSGNILHGNIPPCLCELRSLESLYLSGNQLQGNIPPCLCELRSLADLDLSGNRLHGEIPKCLSNMSSLRHLDISNNQFQGSIPSLIHNLTAIESLVISDNQFEGLISFSIFANLSMLRYLGLSHNDHLQVETENPIWLPPFQFEGLMLGGCNLNSLSGNKIPSFISTQYHLKFLDLSDNHLHGEIQQSIVRNISSLEHLDLSNNSLQAELMLPGDCSMPKLRWLHLSNNAFTGSIPHWLSNSPSLEILLLRGNRVEGPIPTQLCQMQNLRLLDLSNNNLSGSIPSCFNNISSWTEEFRSRRENFISGVSMSTQEFPPRYLLLSLMSVIDLSVNQLSGAIPVEIGYLRNIDVLNISRNLFTGHVPTSFGNLKNMEALDLSRNNLTGVLPPNLTALTFLSAFDVSHNNLSGMIPRGNQFDTFDNLSYEGNPGLCGLPLSSKCSNKKPVRPDGKAGEKSGVVENPLHLNSSVAILYFWEFWCFIFILMMYN